MVTLLKVIFKKVRMANVYLMRILNALRLQKSNSLKLTALLKSAEMCAHTVILIPDIEKCITIKYSSFLVSGHSPMPVYYLYNAHLTSPCEYKLEIHMHSLIQTVILFTHA